MLGKMNDIKISSHFNLKEFVCPCCGLVKIHPYLIVALEELRARLCLKYQKEVYLNIVSGFRCQKHNEEVGGAPSSDHIFGYAGDIVAFSDTEIIPMSVVYESAKNVDGIKRIGYGPTKFHVGAVERDGLPNFWEYN